MSSALAETGYQNATPVLMSQSQCDPNSSITHAPFTPTALPDMSQSMASLHDSGQWTMNNTGRILPPTCTVHATFKITKPTKKGLKGRKGAARDGSKKYKLQQHGSCGVINDRILKDSLESNINKFRNIQQSKEKSIKKAQVSVDRDSMYRSTDANFNNSISKNINDPHATQYSNFNSQMMDTSENSFIKEGTIAISKIQPKQPPPNKNTMRPKPIKTNQK